MPICFKFKILKYIFFGYNTYIISLIFFMANKKSILDMADWEWTILKFILNYFAKILGQKTNPDELCKNLQKIRKWN